MFIIIAGYEVSPKNVAFKLAEQRLSATISINIIKLKSFCMFA